MGGHSHTETRYRQPYPIYSINGDQDMTNLTLSSVFNSIRRKFGVGAMLVGVTFSQLGCGCECATAATVVGLATPVVWVAREVQEAKKTELEIERLEAAKHAEYHR